MAPEIFWSVLLVLLGICVVFLVPLMLQLRRTAHRAEQFMEQTQNDLVPLLKDLREASESAARLARIAEEDFSQISPLFRSLGEAGQSLHVLTGALQGDLFRYAGSALGFWLGMRSMKKAFSSTDNKAEKETDHGR